MEGKKAEKVRNKKHSEDKGDDEKDDKNRYIKVVFDDEHSQYIQEERIIKIDENNFLEATTPNARGLIRINLDKALYWLDMRTRAERKAERVQENNPKIGA